MRLLLIGYMFLFIDRPFEVWPWLGDLHIERVYMLFTLGVWAVYPNKRWLPNAQHAAYAALATAVLFCWAVSPWADKGQNVVEDWLKIVVFYVLLVTTIHDEEGLKQIAAGFLVVMGLYLLHSFREYLGGRHTYRMGISRMIGVDNTLGDPNSFGASIVFALPLVTAFWRSGVGGRWGKVLLSGYVGLSCLCILLTGSRSSLLGLLVWFLIVIWGTKYRFKALAAFAVAAPLSFVALPESLQTRFETIINPDVGPKNAEESGQGRIEGLTKGFELWQASPLTGVGPGAWRPATRSKIESHNLYGQLMGETGALGVSAFVFLLGCFWMNLRAVKRAREYSPDARTDFLFLLPTAIGVSVFLLLFMGNFGHNLFRFTWLWFGGFLIVARSCVARRVAVWEPEAEPAEDEEPAAAGALPPGWIFHPPHVQ
ncbi:MAG TPA: O-antigen ligase family protein [Gemmataceae bacterium]|nr:O-antigen ligase family protein [Gemmataceae bacterium]